MSEQEIAGVLSAAVDAENARRRVASDAPGLGSLMHLDDTAYFAVGKAGLLPEVGEGYGQGAPESVQVTSYGPARPVYADGLVGGQGYGPGAVQGAVRALGEAVFAAQDARAAGPRVVVVSPDLGPRRSLWSRLRGTLRAVRGR